jgi:hypothetical protein
VLLHGGYGDSRDWTLQLTSLADAFDVIAWDAPGCGGSDDPPTDWTLADYAAEEVAARLERIRAEVAEPPSTWIDGYLPGFFANPVAPEVLGLLRSTMLDIRPAGVLPMLHAFADADLTSVLPTITVPTLRVP